MAALKPRLGLQCALAVLSAAAMLAVAAGAAAGAEAACVPEEPSSPPSSAPHHPRKTLATNYFGFYNPDVEVVSPDAVAGGLRAGRTRVRVRVRGPGGVAPFTPMLVPYLTGMRHMVVNTWQALKNYALMSGRTERLNAQAAAAAAAAKRGASSGATTTTPPPAQQYFPFHWVAVTTALDGLATQDVAALIDEAEALGQRRAWTKSTPANILLQPAGAAVAAIADVMSITLLQENGGGEGGGDGGGGDTLVMDLDVVHEPAIATEFVPHAKQVLDPARAHYHQLPGEDVAVDAAGVLRALREADYRPLALHTFFKAYGPPCCWFAALSAAPSPDDPTLTRVTANMALSKAAACCSDASPAALDACQKPQFTWTGSAVAVRSSQGTGSCSRGSGGPRARPAPGAASQNGTQHHHGDSQQQQQHASGGRQEAGQAAQAQAAAAQQAGRVVEPPFAFTDAGGRAWIDLRPLSAVVRVSVRSVFAYPAVTVTNTPAFVTLSGPGPVARLELSPAKAYRHVREPAALTVLALNASGAPVPGASVVLAAFGDCEPLLGRAAVTTDAAGRATAYVSASKPGAVAVVAVAAAQDGSGARLVTPAAHVIFFEERRHVEAREEEQYYHLGHAASAPEAVAASEGAAAAGIDDDASEADRFAAEATRLALAQLPA